MHLWPPIRKLHLQLPTSLLCFCLSYVIVSRCGDIGYNPKEEATDVTLEEARSRGLQKRGSGEEPVQGGGAAG